VRPGVYGDLAQVVGAAKGRASGRVVEELAAVNLGDTLK
jgi:hypothetical protein